MPLYDHACDNCGHADTEYATMANAIPVGDCSRCPKCGHWLYRRQVSLPHTDLKEFHVPIEMYSIALDTDAEIAAFRAKAGSDVRVSDDQNDPMYGIPIAANRKQKLRALEAAGYRERN